MLTACSPEKSTSRAIPSARAKNGLEVHFVTLDELAAYAHLHTPIYFDLAYLKAVLVNDSEELRHIFPCVFFGGVPVAYGAFCLLRRGKNQVINGIINHGNSGRIWKQTLKSILPLVFGTCDSHVQILIAGNMLVSGPYGLHFSSACDSDLHNTVWTQVLKAVDENFGAPVLTVVKDFLSSEESSATSFLRGFFRVDSLPLMMMNLPSQWNGFTDYLNAMSTKYRTRARSALTKAGNLTTEYWNADQIRQNSAALYTLYLEVYKRAKFRIQPVSEAYILRLAEEFSDGRFRFIVWKNGDQLIGFSSAFFHKGQLDAHLIGMDYSYNKSHSLYLNMIYRYIQDAIELRANCIDFGRTAMEIKSTAGAIPVELDVWIRLRSGVGNKLAGRLSSKLKSESWVQRHPFKIPV